MPHRRNPEGPITYAGGRPYLDEGVMFNLKQRHRDQITLYRVEETLGLFVSEKERKFFPLDVAAGKHVKQRTPKRGRHSEYDPPPPVPPKPHIVRCLVDAKTGTLYDAHTGECFSTSQLRIVNVRSGGRLAA